MKRLILLILFFLLLTGCSKTEYEVKFNSNGGTAIESQLVENNHTATRPVNPIKEGYVFLGWKLDNKEYTFKEKVNKDIVLDATWQLSGEVKSYKITYKIDDKVTETTVLPGQCAIEPKSPTKNGHTFLGWYLDEDEDPYPFDKIVTEDITLIAKFEKDEDHSSTNYSNQTIFVTELEISSSMLELEKNETVKIEIKVLPENASNKKVKFKTSNKRILTVDDDGVVMGVRPGEATITVETTDTSNISKELTFTVVGKKKNTEETKQED